MLSSLAVVTAATAITTAVSRCKAACFIPALRMYTRPGH